MATVNETGTTEQTPSSTQEANGGEVHLLKNIRVSIAASSVDNTSVSGKPIISTVEDATVDGAAGTASV